MICIDLLSWWIFHIAILDYWKGNYIVESDNITTLSAGVHGTSRSYNWDNHPTIPTKWISSLLQTIGAAQVFNDICFWCPLRSFVAKLVRMLYVNEPTKDCGRFASCWGYLLLTVVQSQNKIFPGWISERRADILSARSVYVKNCHVRADEKE